MLMGVVMWVTPAVLAEIFGWRGIWGGGSAFGDLIVPAPITGGIFHVPTFIAALLYMRAYDGLDERTAWVVRASISAAALLGLLMILDLEQIYVGLLTDVPADIELDQNYFGICLMTDAAWTASWMYRRRIETRHAVPATTIVLVPALAYLAMVYFDSDRATETFVFGRPQPLATRGDEIVWIFTRQDVLSPTFREDATRFVEPHRPDEDVNAEDTAFYFTDSMFAAREYGDGPVLATLCAYEDGTADQWHAGQADCFSDHLSFSDEYAAYLNRTRDRAPSDVSVLAFATARCPGVVYPERDTGGHALRDFCRYLDLDERRRQLGEKYGADELPALLQIATDLL